MTHTVGVNAAVPTAMFASSVSHPIRVPPGDQASILVVDDDSNLLRMLRRSLVFAGYSVRVAEVVSTPCAWHWNRSQTSWFLM